MRRWYLAKSKPQKETLLTLHLTRWDVEVFAPKIRRPNARDVSQLEPLFPTYVFLRTEPDSPAWPAIRWSIGLAYILQVDQQPSVVPDAVVDYIRGQVQNWNQGGYRHRFQRGDRVAVLGGPFNGLEGLFLEYSPARQRCQILVDMMNRLIPVEVPDWNLGLKTAGYALLSGAPR